MKFRRHVPRRIDWTAWMPRTGAWLRAIGRVPALRPLGRLPGNRALWWIASAIGALAAGYLVAALVLFPAPIFASAIAVPRVLGLSQADAEEALSGLGLVVGEPRTETHPTATPGDVVWQDPPPGVAVPPGHTVDLTVSAGPQRIPVPDLSGYDEPIAQQLVLAAGLVVGRVERTQAPAPRGVVINSRPPAGSTLRPGTEVTLVVSVGAPTITVPDLTGLTREQADSALTHVGLALGTAVRRTTSVGAPGTVIEQNPQPGTLSAPGTAVNITLVREGG